MAALTAWLTANLPTVAAAFAAAVIAWINRDKIKAWGAEKKTEMQADIQGIDLSQITDLLKQLGSDVKNKKDAVERGVVLLMLVKIESKVEELSNTEARDKGRQLVKDLSALFVVPQDPFPQLVQRV